MVDQRPKFTNYQDYLIWRVKKRVDRIKSRGDSLIAGFIKTTPEDMNTAEEDRIWLDGFAKGYGIDVCCGDFLVGVEEQAIGVDGASSMLGTDIHVEADELSMCTTGGYDYVVTNYLDGLPNPIKGLTEWHRVLKPGGVIAIVCRDAIQADADNPINGALSNHRKQSAYCAITLKNYLNRCGFRDVTVEVTSHGTLRATGITEVLKASPCPKCGHDRNKG